MAILRGITGEFVAARRRERHMSMDEFADHVGVTRQTVANWESGRAPISRIFEKHWAVILAKLDGGEVQVSAEDRLRQRVAEKLDRERIEKELRKERHQPRPAQRNARVNMSALPDMSVYRDYPGPDGLTDIERGHEWTVGVDPDYRPGLIVKD